MTLLQTMRTSSALASLAIGAIAAGCTVQTKNQLNDTQRAQETATPDARPFDAITDFSESLQCMDDYLIRYKVRDLSVLVVEDRDVTGQVVGAKDMAVTALSKMARKSKSIKVVSIAPAHAPGVDAYIAGVGDRVPPNSDRRMLPKYFITISMPQIDNAVSTDRKSAGMRILGAVGLEYDNDKLMSSMSIDLNMGDMLTASSIPGVYSSNTVAIKRTGHAIGSSGEINKLGAVFNMSTDRNEGFHHSLRQLVELGAIELIGRLTQIPYWECLNISNDNAPVQRQIQDWYESLTPSEFILFAQTSLQATGFYAGPVDGANNPDLQQAIARFRQSLGALPTAHLDASLFRQLLANNSPPGNSSMTALPVRNPGLAKKLTAGNNAMFARTRPLQLKIDIGSQTSFSPGQTIQAMIHSSVDSYVYCYYQQIDSQPIKLFPNRFRPNSFVQAGARLALPGGDRFNIMTDKKGDVDTLMCMASYDDLEHYQAPVADLRQLDGFSDLSSVHAYYQRTARQNGLNVPLVSTTRIVVE